MDYKTKTAVIITSSLGNLGHNFSLCEQLSKKKTINTQTSLNFAQQSTGGVFLWAAAQNSENDWIHGYYKILNTCYIIFNFVSFGDLPLA